MISLMISLSMNRHVLTKGYSNVPNFKGFANDDQLWGSILPDICDVLCEIHGYTNESLMA